MIENSRLKDFFAKRIYELRNERNISARELSLTMGQNSSYINRIENRITLPSIQGLLCICECLDITPYDFFNPGVVFPHKTRSTIDLLNQLDEEELEALHFLVSVMIKNKKND